jgi:phosphomannomutase
MYGAGRGYLDEFIQGLGCAVTLIHGERNPLFGGRLPDPVEENLTQLSQGVVGSKAALGLALDGDADRFGIVDATGRYVNPNQVITIAYYHLLTTRGMKGPAIRTTATTRQVDALAKLVGEDCYEVPVGFKFVGQKLSETNAVLGGEESGGLSIRGHIPEKDGPLADLLILEHYCSSNQTPMETLAEINQKTGEFHTTRLDLHIQPGAKERLMRSLQNAPPGKFASQPATAKMVDGVTLTLADGSWCMIRPSGTEPVVRFYLESNDAAVLREMESDARSLVEGAEREI